MHSLTKLAFFYWLQLTFVLALGLYLLFFGSWQLETNLLSLLPNNTQSQEMELAEHSLFANKQNQIVIIVSGEHAVAAHHALQKSIISLKNIEIIATPKTSIEALSEFYLPYRHNFLPQKYLNALDDKSALAQLVTGQLTELANPFVSATLAGAPRLNLAKYLQEALMKMVEVEYFQGVPAIIKDQDVYLISRLQLKVEGFSLKDSGKVAVQLQNIFEQIQSTHTVELHYSGIIFHTAESMSQAQQEISIFGTLSLLSVVVLLLVVFRSLTPLFISLVTVMIAFLYGITAILLLFNKLHILTLVFAVTLIGIVIDYCFHFFVYATQSQFEQNKIEKKPKSIIKPLMLSFVTTAFGYFALVFSPLTMLSQVAVFMIFGLLGALLTVLVCLPASNQLKRISINATVLKLSVNTTLFFERLLFKRVFILPLIIAGLTMLFCTQSIVFDDNVKLLNSSPDWLLQHEEKVANVFKYRDAIRLVVKANTVQQLLEKQELIIDQLLAEQPNLSIKSIADFLPSIKRQKRNFNLLKQADELGGFLKALAITDIKDPVVFFNPLTFDHFIQGPLLPLSMLYIANYEITQSKSPNKKMYAAWLTVSGKLSKKNEAWIANTNNVSKYDKAHDVSLTLAAYRQNIMWLVMIAFVVVAVMLTTKFGLKAGVLATVITVSSGLTALIASQWLIGYLNIFNLLAVLLILALAIDYVIFYHEQGLLSGTFLAITLSALSSIFVFGMLVFSKTPAVSSFGLTVMIGIVTIFILAPLSSIKK